MPPHIEYAADLPQLWGELTGRRRAFDAFVAAERAAVLNRFWALLPRRLREAVEAGRLADLEPFTAPMRVRAGGIGDSAPRTSNPFEFDDLDALAESEDHNGTYRRYAPAHAPGYGAHPSSPTLTGQFDQWLKNESGGQRPAVVLAGDPGGGKTWQAVRLALLLLARAGDRTDPNWWLPAWVTCYELGDRTRAESRTTAEAVCAILADRLVARYERANPDGPEADVRRLRAGFVQLWNERLRQKRVALFADAFDESDRGDVAALPGRMVEWVRETGCPLLVTTRLLGVGAELPALLRAPHGCAVWRLLPLDTTTDERPPAVLAWYGPDDPLGLALTQHMAARPELAQMARTPLLGAVICYLWDTAQGRTELPDRPAQLLQTAVNTFLGLPWLGAAIDTRRALLREHLGWENSEDALDWFADQALRTFTAERWRVTGHRLAELVGGAGAGPNDRRRQRNVVAALLGLGLFTDLRAGPNALEAEYEVLHQRFAEFLCARGLLTRFKLSGAAPDRAARLARFRRWLNEQVGHRLLDGQWQEVWALVAGLLGADGVVLAEAVLARTNDPDAPPALPSDRTRGLALAGQWLTAAGGWDTPAGRDLLRDLTREVAGGSERGWRAAREGLIALARANRPETLLGLVTDSNPDVRRRAAGLLDELGALAVPALRGAITAGPGAARVAAARALARLAPTELVTAARALLAADPDGSAPLAAPLLQIAASRKEAECGSARWLLVDGGGVWSAELLRLLHGGDRPFDPASAEATTVAGVLAETGEPALPALLAAAADPHPRFRAFAIQTLAGFGPQAVPYLVARLAESDGVRDPVLAAVGRMGGAAVVPLFEELLAHPGRRDAVYWCLCALGAPAAEALERFIRDPLDACAEAAIAAIHWLSKDRLAALVLRLYPEGEDVPPGAVVFAPPLVETLAYQQHQAQATAALERLGALAVPALLAALARQPAPDAAPLAVLRRLGLRAVEGMTGGVACAGPAVHLIAAELRRVAPDRLVAAGRSALERAAFATDTHLLRVLVRELAELAHERGSAHRETAAVVLATASPEAARQLAAVATDPGTPAPERAALARALGLIDGPAYPVAEVGLIAMLTDADTQTRQAAAAALCRDTRRPNGNQTAAVEQMVRELYARAAAPGGASYLPVVTRVCEHYRLVLLRNGDVVQLRPEPLRLPEE